MSREATCFSCRQVLHVSADAQDRWLTCPRCLASVGNPNVLLPAEPPSLSSEQGPTALRLSPVPVALEARPNRNSRSLDDEVRGDSRGTNFVAVGLGAVLILGVVLFVVIGGPMMVQAGTDPGQVLFVGLLAIGAFLAGVVALAIGARRQAITAVSGIVGGLIAGAGAMLLVVFVAFLTVAAAVTNFMHTCGCK